MSGFFGDLIDAFTGKSARNDIQAGKTEANSTLSSGLTSANQYYNQASSNLTPYVQGGNALYGRYLDTLGVNGADAQKAAEATYMSDPIQQALMDRITRSNQRAFTASGMNNSGAATQSLTNALLANYGGWQSQLAQGGQQGMQAASGQAGIYGQQGDNQISVANQQAGVDTGAANATAASRSTPWNNLIGLAGAGANVYRAYNGVSNSK